MYDILHSIAQAITRAGLSIIGRGPSRAFLHCGAAAAALSQSIEPDVHFMSSQNLLLRIIQTATFHCPG